MRKNKIKKTIDLTDDTCNLMIQTRAEYELKSDSALVNMLLQTFCSLPQHVKDELADACSKMFECEKRKLNIGDYSDDARRCTLTKLEKMYWFFSRGKNLDTPTAGESQKRKVRLANGIVEFPSDWVELNYCKPECSLYAGVVEIKDGPRYNLPHFIFYSSKPINELSQEDCDTINELCCELYPIMRDVLNMHQDMKYDENGKISNLQDLKYIPFVGHFQIPFYGDPLYGMNEENYPCRAFVKRYK